jgi:hypothetical protein
MMKQIDEVIDAHGGWPIEKVKEKKCLRRLLEKYQSQATLLA